MADGERLFDIDLLQVAEEPGIRLRWSALYAVLRAPVAAVTRHGWDLAALEEFAPVADRFLLDAKPPPGATLPGGNAAPFDWRLTAGRVIPRPWLLAGGLLYTAGGVIYALKRPAFEQRHPNFGMHEIFHLFVMAGSFCHYLVMYVYML